MHRPRKHPNRRDAAQNIAITLLSVLAVVLFARTQLYSLSPEGSILGRWFHAAPSITSPLPAEESGVLSAPVRAVVSGTYGRYGDLTLSTDDPDAFGRPLSTLLSEALGSAKSFSPCSQEEFQEALSRPSLYYDFFNPLPLSVLADLIDLADSTAPDSISARQLVISGPESGVVQLLLWDGASGYLRCDTAIKASRLADAVSRYELGNAFFASDQSDSNQLFTQVSPRSLFLSPMPQLPVLSVSSPSADTDQVLTLLGFSPYTNSRYKESTGTEVIVEGDQSLRLLTDGRIRYQSGGRETLSIPAQGETPTLQEAADGTARLLNQLLNGSAGDASLYLLEIRQSELATTLRFGYQCDGVPIRFTDGSAAAEVRLSGTAVSSLSLRLRQYTAKSASAAVLPLEQAIAIAAQQPVGELSLAYTDSGSSQADVSWLLD